MTGILVGFCLSGSTYIGQSGIYLYGLATGILARVVYTSAKKIAGKLPYLR